MMMVVGCPVVGGSLSVSRGAWIVVCCRGWWWWSMAPGSRYPSRPPPLFLQLFLRREENPLGVALGDVEDLADLGVTETLDLEEDEDAAALLGELVEEPAQSDPLPFVDARRGPRGRHEIVQ